MPGIYDTAVLTRVVQRIHPLPTLFLDTFFREAVNSEKEEIYFDVVEDKPRITPFVHPLRAGKLVEDAGFSTKSFKPAYVKDKRIFNPTKAIKRMVGEDFNGTMTMEQRIQANLRASLDNQKKMLTRRLEIMAAEAIINGTQTIVGDGIDAVVDFQRDSELTISLTSTAKWDYSTKVNQSDDLEEWSQLLLDKCGSGRAIVIMDKLAWKLFKRDEKVVKLMDKMYKPGDGSNVNLAPRFRAEGATYKGNIGDFELWVYSHTYVDTDGTTKNVMPDNTVIMASPDMIEGVRHFGAIMDLDNLSAVDTFVKSWTEPEPSVRYLLLQSAPLMVPYRPNASIKITVA